MVVNEELIAAYIDGNVTVEERNEVRKYLAQHPVEQDLVFSLMEEIDITDKEIEKPKAKVISMNQEQSYSEIAYAAAAFAPKVAINAPKGKLQNPISQRLERMSAFLKELDQEN